MIQKALETALLCGLVALAAVGGSFLLSLVFGPSPSCP
jgi:hypothetical protein